MTSKGETIVQPYYSTQPVYVAPRPYYTPPPVMYAPYPAY
jgi:hypothetical protein